MSSHSFKQPRIVRVGYVDAKYLTHYHCKIRTIPANPPNKKIPLISTDVLKLLGHIINSLKYEFRGISQLN